MHSFLEYFHPSMAPHTDSMALTAEEDEQASLAAMKLACGSALQMAVRAAIELGLIDLLVQAGPGTQLSSADVAEQLRATHSQAASMVDRILCLLAANNVVRCTVPAADEGDGIGGGPLRRYGPAPVCKYLARNEVEGSIGPLHLMNHDKVFMESWYYLKDAVLEGGVPFDKAHGMSAFEYPSKNPKFNKVFNEGMKNHSIILTRKLLEIYQGFDNVKEVLVDVGGGLGVNLGMITHKHSHLKGINFDLLHVISQAPSFPGVKHLSGDMFASIPNGDAIFMKWILHDWSDEHCAKILENCSKALAKDGKVIIFERILPEVPEPILKDQYVLQVDLLMLAYNPGGRERTIKQFQHLAQGAGFSGFTAIYIFSGMWVMELTK